MQHALTTEMTARHRAMNVKHEMGESQFDESSWNSTKSDDVISSLTLIKSQCDGQLDAMLSGIERLKREMVDSLKRDDQSESIESIATIAINARSRQAPRCSKRSQVAIRCRAFKTVLRSSSCVQTVDHLMQNLDRLSFDVCVAALQGGNRDSLSARDQHGNRADESIEQLKILVKASDRAIDSMWSLRRSEQLVSATRIGNQQVATKCQVAAIHPHRWCDRVKQSESRSFVRFAV